MYLRYLVIAAFVIHGLAHMSGFMAAWTSRDSGFTQNPWLFSRSSTLRSAMGKGFGLLWLVASIALVGSGLGILLWPGLWPVLPVVASIISLAVIIPWWNTVVPGAKVGAAYDVLALIALLPSWSQRVMAALGL